MPGVFTVKLNPVTSTVPPGPSGVIALVEAGGPAQVPFRNQSTVTLPVGTGAPGWPVTVTKSCTFVPTPTAVTTACAALWICVAVVEGSCATGDDEPADACCGA